MAVRKNTDTEDPTASVTASSVNAAFAVNNLDKESNILSACMVIHVITLYLSGRYQQDEAPNLLYDCKPWCKQFQDGFEMLDK